MAIVNGYATLAQVKYELGLVDDDKNNQIERYIEAASRMIDQDCAPKHFYSVSADEYFTPHFGDEVQITKPLDSITTLSIYANETYDTEITSSDYEAVGSPIHTIYLKPTASNRFPRIRRGVKVTGVWGITPVPAAIEEACVLMAKIMYLRKDAVQGIIDGGEAGAVKLGGVLNDPQVRDLLSSVSHAEVY